MTAPRSPVRWNEDNRKCSHTNDDVCPFCDFDGYYAANYPDCPWRAAADDFCPGPATPTEPTEETPQ